MGNSESAHRELRSKESLFFRLLNQVQDETNELKKKCDKLNEELNQAKREREDMLDSIKTIEFKSREHRRMTWDNLQHLSRRIEIVGCDFHALITKKEVERELKEQQLSRRIEIVERDIHELKKKREVERELEEQKSIRIEIVERDIHALIKETEDERELKEQQLSRRIEIVERDIHALIKETEDERELKEQQVSSIMKTPEIDDENEIKALSKKTALEERKEETGKRTFMNSLSIFRRKNKDENKQKGQSKKIYIEPQKIYIEPRKEFYIKENQERQARLQSKTSKKTDENVKSLLRSSLPKVQIFYIFPREKMFSREIVTKLETMLKRKVDSVDFVQVNHSSEIDDNMLLIIVCIALTRPGADVKHADKYVRNPENTVILLIYLSDEFHVHPESSQLLFGGEFRHLHGVFDMSFSRMMEDFCVCDLHKSDIDRLILFCKQKPKTK